jgi:uncharacterized UPF0160 family protein
MEKKEIKLTKSINFDFENFNKKGELTKSVFNENDYTEFVKRFGENVPIYTHNGQFHADDAFSVALVFLVYVMKNEYYDVQIKHLLEPNLKLRLNRVKECTKEMYDSGIVLDLLNGHFDHHMANDEDKHYFTDEHGEKDITASFGALWDVVGSMFNIDDMPEGIVNFNVKEKVYHDFVHLIDRADLYGPKKVNSPISKAISNMNSYDEYDFDFVKSDDFSSMTDDEKQNLRFLEAVCFAYKILKGEIRKAQHLMLSLKNVGSNKNIMISANKNGVTYLLIKEVEKGEKEPFVPLEALDYITIPWRERAADGLGFKEVVRKIDLLVNMNPSLRDGTYRAIAADSNKVPFDPKCHEHAGVKFYHPQNFMITFETKEDLRNFIDNVSYRYETIVKNGNDVESLYPLRSTLMTTDC